MRRLAIDPGDAHVGWAYDATNGEDEPEVGEWAPTECCEAITYLLTHDRIDEIIVEEFLLYQQEYANQAWSPMKTSQLIGAIKWIAHMFRIPVVEQGAYIKKPTRAKMRRLKIKLVAVPRSDGSRSPHADDAQLHLHHRRLKEAA